MSRIIFTCASLFLLSLCGQEVHAVFNITRIALDFSISIREQIEKSSVYHSEEDVTYQLTLISTMLKKFYNESENFKATVNFDFNVCRWQNDELMSICLKLQDYSWFNDFFSNNVTFDDLYNPFRVFIQENDYNLLLPKTYNESLNDYHTVIFTPDPDAGMSIVDIIIRNQAQSQNQIIYNLIKMIASMDARGFAMRQFSYALYKVQLDAANFISKDVIRKIQMDTVLWSEKNITSKMLKAEREFSLRNVKTYRKLKSLVPSLDRHVYGCIQNLTAHPASVPFPAPEKLPAIFQKYIINEGDMDEQNSCSKVCPDFREAKVRGCYDKGSICNWQPTCTGTLWDCESVRSPMRICLLTLRSTKRYEFFEIDGNSYGKKPKEPLSDCGGLIMKAESWTRGFFECTYCMCTCENNYIDQDRYFSLRPALSDMNSNHVVTAVKWLKKNGIWHIQIQQGKLLSNGVIGMNLEWKDVDNFKINDPYIAVGTDYYALTWYNRTILLDSLSSPKNYVLTGLQFVSVDNYLKLKIRVTRFDFATGELFPEQTQWLLHASPLQDRTELDLEKLQDYLDCKLKKDTYFRFTTSSLEIDAGQSIVPALSSEIVETNPPVPLSGAGIYLKNPAGDVQLDFKIETYDFAPHL